MFSIRVNCVGWELGSRGRQPRCSTGHNTLQATRKHWRCPHLVTRVPLSLRLIALMSHPLPRASYVHGADTAGFVPNIRNPHLPWDRNRDQIIYLCFMTGGINATKRKGSKIMFIPVSEHCGSPILFHLIKKWKKKIKSALNTIVLLRGGDTGCSRFNVLRQLPVAKRSSERPP